MAEPTTGHLLGLSEYLAENYGRSVFDEALAAGAPYRWHVHPGRTFSGPVTENLVYDVRVHVTGSGVELLPKVQVKFLYPVALIESVGPQLRAEPQVQALGLEPIPAPGKRFHVKNKSLYPLMRERTVLFFTLLEGELLRGIVAGFTRYEITLHVKGGHPVTLLRHAVRDIRDKRGRCFLKSFQEIHRDWTKSPLYVA